MGKLTRIMQFVLCAILLVAGGTMSHAAGGKEVPIPQITIDLDETTYISPGIADGVQDSAEFKATIRAAERLVVKGYSITVADSLGTEVFVKTESVTEEDPFFRRMLIAVGFATLKTPVTVPETLSWNGTDTAGAPVDEGDYILVVSGWDDKGRTGTSKAHNIVVDNTAPAVELTLPYAVFSPNADGNQDIMIIEHSAGVEAEWISAIKDSSGAAIREYRWRDSEPENVIWDGSDSAGKFVADGTYSYHIKGTDRAGSTYETTFSPITVDTRDTPISISRDLAFFSPNGDRSQDSLEITPVIPVTEGIKSWSITISNSSGVGVRVYSGAGDTPGNITFDGLDDSGAVLREGAYRAELSVLYTNGNNPVAKTEEFGVDLTPPSVALRTNPRIISPNEDGRQDRLFIYQETSAEEVWNGRITDEQGNLVRSVTWRGTAEQAIEWDGLDQLGELVPNGTYIYSLSSRDTAGNYARAESDPVRVDLRETPVGLSIEGDAFSPNADSRKDTISLIPDITDTSGVDTLTVTFYDSSDTVIRKLSSTEIPEKFSWDGKNDAGRKVPDGSYSAELVVEYENGNAPKVKAGPIIVDTRLPSLKVAVANLYFSPDGDGSGDTLQVSQTESSSEQIWSAAMLDGNGQPVRTFLWTGRAESFTWDGSDEDGNVLPDGAYSYSIESTDRAGNRFAHIVEGITIDTRATPVALRISGTAFSPNGDAVRDTLVLDPQLEITENIASWKLDIYDKTGVIKRSYRGDSTPSSVEFDGYDNNGKRLPEGSFFGDLSVLYKNGNNPSARSGDFAIDLTPPVAEVSANASIVSPNGDGNKDTIVVSQSGTEEAEWRGVVRNSSGFPVRTFTWFGEPAGRTEWDGKDDDGKIAGDGVYTYRLETTDKAGNKGESNAVTFKKDTRVTALALVADSSAFSPNGDGKKDRIVFSPQIGLAEGITSYKFTIETLTGTVVFSEAKNSNPPASFTWQGHAADGFRVPDGQYRSRIALTYEHGNSPEASSPTFLLDTKIPSVQLTAEYQVFSPDGDGRKDRILIRQETSEENLWEGSIRNAATGVKVADFFWKGRAEALAWDGKDSAGNIAGDGLYTYEITCTDTAGNSNRAALSGIKIDNRKTSGYVNPGSTAFSPNGDGNNDAMRLNLYTSPPDGISSWRLSVTDASGRAVRAFEGTGAPGTGASVPAYVAWDGKRTDGSIIDGNYRASLRVEYEKGNLVEAEASREFLLDATPPSYAFSITPPLFSPDDDGIQDTVTLAIENVRDTSSIAEWRLEVRDPTGKLFFSRSGRGEPTRAVVWDGKSNEGELVQAAEDYPVTVTVTDSHGNAGIKETVIPVDVLVFREGDRLKIRISSIAFAPNSADFLNFDAEKAEKNMKTLRRLAEILQKYSAYQIRIEGHAVSVYWDNAQRAKREEAEELIPLSTARAEAVKAVLIDLGIAERRMTAVGLGGSQPVVPHGDLENRWKSRRVEFILVK
ncbi:MAG: OmpA family protein [Spirochaetales bacterium]|nr:OmpA family protein [Spirochaetales bacterium]